MSVALNMFFSFLSNTKLNFEDQEPNWRLYTTVKIFPITKKIELIKKKKFSAAAFDSDNISFIIYITFFINFDLKVHIYPSHMSHIISVIIIEISIVILSKYVDFTNIFFLEFATKFLGYRGINNYPINQIDSQ